MVFVTFFGYLMGRYTAGLAHGTGYRSLRAAGSYLVGNVATSLLLIFAMAMLHFEVEWPEGVAGYVIPGVMGLVGVEILFNLVLDIYRPRVPGQEHRAAYDSRLLGLVAEPGGILKTVASTLDYQFGFKVSDTWFYRFMERAIVPLILVQLLTLWLLSGMVVVERGEVAFIETFGQPRIRAEDEGRLQASVYGPGYHVKWPWPIEVTRIIPSDRIYRKEIGKIYYAEEGGQPREGPPPGGPEEEIHPMTDENVILWNEFHVDPKEGYEANFLVPSVGDVTGKEAPAINIARVQANVHYRIKRGKGGGVDPAAAYEFRYGHTDIPRLVDDLAYKVMCQIAARQNFLNWLHKEREQVSDAFAAALQKELIEHKTGIELVYAGIPVVHPPAETAKDFEGVINAYEEKEKTIHEAHKDATVKVNQAEGQAAQTVGKANSYSYELSTLAKAEADRFEIQLGAYRRAPEVYRFRKYFFALERVLEGHRLYVGPITENEVQIFDLQDKLRADILEVELEEGAQ